MTNYGPRRARRTDDNHAEIRDALRDVPGVYCHDVSAVAGLGFDLLCNFRGGPPMFLEVKRPATRDDLTDSECRARLLRRPSLPSRRSSSGPPRHSPYATMPRWMTWPTCWTFTRNQCGG